MTDKPRRKPALRRRLDNAGSMALAGVPVLGFVIFGLFPMVMSLMFSFTDVSFSLREDFDFVGVSNFVRLLKDSGFRLSILNTFKFTLTVPLTLGVSLYIAYLIEKCGRGKRFFRLVFFIPYVCSSVAISLVFKQMYDTHYGILNTLLHKLGLKGIPWISNKYIFMFSAIFLSVWSGVGFCVILYEAALSKVNVAYYEAARIDGATDRQIFFKITLPAITPTTFYLLVMRLIGALQVFTEPQILAGGSTGLDGWDITVVMYVMRCINGGWASLGLGYGSAAGWIIAIIIIFVTWLNFKLSDKWTNYDMT